MVNVGFGSSSLNIPFATTKLITYNCAAATRYFADFELPKTEVTIECIYPNSCSSCLQSDGVCVWCNVVKRCTAVTSSCTNVISVS